eukprot:2261524-Pyramimonas_sp.AAC.1
MPPRRAKNAKQDAQGYRAPRALFGVGGAGVRAPTPNQPTTHTMGGRWRREQCSLPLAPHGQTRVTIGLLPACFPGKGP